MTGVEANIRTLLCWNIALDAVQLVLVLCATRAYMNAARQLRADLKWWRTIYPR